jgi:phage-related protein
VADPNPVDAEGTVLSESQAEAAGRISAQGGPERSSARRRWRQYETAAGKRPVLEFIRKIPDEDKAAILAAMKDVRREGVTAARHLRGELFEVRADGDRVIYRILFAREGERGQVLLSLVAFNKKTQKTPPAQIELAMRRLRDWRSRARQA